jgi:uncharacterized surface protein with fasciclin (FAS1) repeats
MKVRALYFLILILSVGLMITLSGTGFANGGMGTMDVVDTAISADDFNTLVTAITEADLVEALKAEGPFTVFAPTDEAFAALPEGVLDGLLENTDELKNVLLYHVVSGKVMAADVVGLDGEMVETLLGEDVMVKVEDGMVYINDAQVITTDIEATNGVIHVIDAVLVP